MADIRTTIWYDLIDSKYGDEYLVLYIAREKKFRKGFKIATMAFSAFGIWSSFSSWKFFIIASYVAIFLLQIATSIENFIIHSEQGLLELGDLRLKYCERFNAMEKLWHKLEGEKISEDDASDAYFNLREKSLEIEALDNKLDIVHRESLKFEANVRATRYFNTYLS